MMHLLALNSCLPMAPRGMMGEGVVGGGVGAVYVCCVFARMPRMCLV